MTSWLRAGVLLTLAIVFLVLVSPTRGDDSESLLRQIQKVGREGAGNEAAATAWKALVGQGTSALEPILVAMHDDQRIAANWLRPAFEAIAEKALAEGKLSKEQLGGFIANKKLAGSARALAYEWLTKMDKTTPDRLLPAMLDDPSGELRRLAVERVLTQAEQLLEAKKEKEARIAFEQALSAACVPEQIEASAKALEKLGTKLDLAKHYGSVQKWHLIGPFDHRKGIGWDVAYPPEKTIDLTATYEGTDGQEVKWITHQTSDATGIVDVNKVLDKHKGAIAYACAFLDSPSEREVEVRAGCINGLKIWLNGQLILNHEEYHHGMRIDQYAGRGKLKKGRNVLLLKVAQNEQTEQWAQEWRFQVRVCDLIGAAVPFTVAGEDKR